MKIEDRVKYRTACMVCFKHTFHTMSPICVRIVAAYQREQQDNQLKTICMSQRDNLLYLGMPLDILVAALYTIVLTLVLAIGNLLSILNVII